MTLYSRGCIIVFFFLSFVKVFTSSRSFRDFCDGVTTQFIIPHRRLSSRIDLPFVRGRNNAVYICIIASICLAVIYIDVKSSSNAPRRCLVEAPIEILHYHFISSSEKVVYTSIRASEKRMIMKIPFPG